METIIFRRSKPKYVFFLLSLLLILSFAGYISTLFILNPSEYTYWLKSNELSVFLAGIVGIIGSLVLLYIVIKSVLNKEFLIRINQDGLFLGLIQHHNKLVRWDDITAIESIKIDGIKHILIQIKNIEYYKNKEKGIQKYFFISKTEKYNTPFVINISALSNNYNDIFDSLILSWKKYKE